MRTRPVPPSGCMWCAWCCPLCKLKRGWLSGVGFWLESLGLFSCCCGRSWDTKMAIRYYQKLHKHYALADLSRWVGACWRVQCVCLVCVTVWRLVAVGCSPRHCTLRAACRADTRSSKLDCGGGQRQRSYLGRASLCAAVWTATKTQVGGCHPVPLGNVRLVPLAHPAGPLVVVDVQCRPAFV
jgi:hypothetical protein